jgi:Ca2+:H+ antiporter
MASSVRSTRTNAVAAKTGDAAGGLLNATLGNLTELVIALTALRAGQYVLVKASIAGAIVAKASAGPHLPVLPCARHDIRPP